MAAARCPMMGRTLRMRKPWRGAIIASSVDLAAGRGSMAKFFDAYVLTPLLGLFTRGVMPDWPFY